MSPPASLEHCVLVVDDDAAFQLLAESVLGSLSLTGAMVRSGEEALRLCETHKPQAVILDGLLPGLRGDEVARRLRQRYPKAQLPILFTSAFYRDLKTYNHLVKECQVDLVLHKPIRAEELRAGLLRLPAIAALVGRAQEPAPGPGAPPARAAGGEEGVELVLNEVGDPELLAEYLGAAQERAVGMRAALASLGEQPAALERLRLEAHRFRGSGSSFGFPEFTRLGQLIDELLLARPEGVFTPSERARLVGLVEALTDKVAHAAGKRPLLAREGSEEPMQVLLLDAPGPLSASCQQAAGFKVVHALEAAVGRVGAHPVDVVVVAADRPGLEPLEAVRRLTTAGARVVLLMGSPLGASERLAGLRAGAHGHVFRLPDAEAVRRVARDYLQPRVEARVVALDGDRGRLAALAEALAPLGLAVEPCPGPEGLLEALERTRPALVVVTSEEGQPQALDSVRALKGDVVWRRLPVLVVGAGDAAGRVAALKAGADDVLALPWTPEELGARALAQVHRLLRAGRESPVDLATGALREPALLELFERALGLARRGGRVLALALVEADLAGVRAAQGAHAAEALAAELAAQLRASFRTTDVLARLGEGRFALLLHDVDAAGARRLLDTKLPAGAGPGPLAGVALRTSVAAFPERPGDARSLLAAALDGLR